MHKRVNLIGIAVGIIKDVVQKFFVDLSADGEGDLLHFWEGLHLR